MTNNFGCHIAVLLKNIVTVVFCVPKHESFGSVTGGGPSTSGEGPVVNFYNEPSVSTNAGSALTR